MTAIDRRSMFWLIIDGFRLLFDRSTARRRRIDEALHSVHNFDIYD